jgi:DNA-binding PucR family transcriptional regulator
MEPHIEQANRALFEGNRRAVIDLLRDRAKTGQELWLLASALDDDDERLHLLRRVYAVGEQPYADLAEEMLRREAEFAEMLRRGPAWQQWLLRRREAIIRISLAVLVISATLVILSLILR